MQCFGEHPLFLMDTDDRRMMMMIIGSIFVVTGVGANLLEWSANTFSSEGQVMISSLREIVTIENANV